jgi:sugar phosphate isomerase/epimerase
MPFKLGVTSGLYYIARGEELATAVRKLGYGLTRGTSAIEIALDVPHEITDTEGTELRHIAKKQELEVLIHGSLTMPFEIPERGEWRDAHDHMQKSIRSAVYAGARYVNFHACLNIWLELMTYAGRKLTMTFCDHEGRFISEILAENQKLREWFVQERGMEYVNDVLTPRELQEAIARSSVERGELWVREEEERRVESMLKKYGVTIADMRMGRVDQKKAQEIEDEMKRIKEDIHKQSSVEHASLRDKYLRDKIREKLAKNGKWDSEELRAIVGVIDGYHIMGHYMFYNKDPIWVEMASLYGKELAPYALNYEDDRWLDKAWDQAQKKNDRQFKEFFYGTIGAKFLEGHVKRIFEWLNNDFIGKEIKGKQELIDIAKNLKITFETPDARDPTHAGLFVLWQQRQIYVAIKNIRKTLKTDKVWMLVDFEHMATQGVDPIKDMEDILKKIPDFGTLAIAIHANAPNPGHAHLPLELGDVRVYKLMWYLYRTGFGKDKLVYVIYERGGGDDPFKQSVETLRHIITYIQKNVDPDHLPPEFFGVKGAVAGSEIRQEAIVRDHAWEPLKDLLEMPEEEWGLLSSSAVKKGKAKEWEKAKNR